MLRPVELTAVSASRASSLAQKRPYAVRLSALEPVLLNRWTSGMVSVTAAQAPAHVMNGAEGGYGEKVTSGGLGDGDGGGGGGGGAMPGGKGDGEGGGVGAWPGGNGGGDGIDFDLIQKTVYARHAAWFLQLSPNS
eukprot:3201010-Prymnesium_polylepis.3